MGHVMRCDQCGQSDDHPKHHFAGLGSYHHDCVPYDLKEQALASSDKVGKIMELAESGVHGDKLRTEIIKLHGSGS
jgi:hypothetical protein